MDHVWNSRNRLLRLGATALIAGIIITAGAPFLCSAHLTRGSTGRPQAAPQQYPTGLEWMAGPPPPGVRLALIKTSDVAVGLVVANGMKAGQTVSSTVVAPSKTRGDTSATEGLVLVDPAVRGLA